MKQMVNRGMGCAQSVNQKVKQNVSYATETLAKYSRFLPLFTFRESFDHCFYSNSSEYIYTVLGIILHGAVCQLIAGLERATNCTGRLLRNVALTRSRKITSGARAFISISKYSDLSTSFVSDVPS